MNGFPDPNCDDEIPEDIDEEEAEMLMECPYCDQGFNRLVTDMGIYESPCEKCGGTGWY